MTVCSNPCFVAADGWPGMAAADFAEFRQRVAIDPEAGLRRFDALQVQGTPRRRALLDACQNWRREKAGEELLTGLGWLESLDQRALPGSLAVPSYTCRQRLTHWCLQNVCKHLPTCLSKQPKGKSKS